MFICACTKKRRDKHEYDLEKKRCPFGMQEFRGIVQEFFLSNLEGPRPLQ